jgi:hypothetical protein
MGRRVGEPHFELAPGDRDGGQEGSGTRRTLFTLKSPAGAMTDPMLSQIGQDRQSNRPGGERRKASLILLGKSRLLQRYDPTRRLLPHLYTFPYVPSPTFFSFLYRSAATLEGDTEVEVRDGGGG